MLKLFRPGISRSSVEVEVEYTRIAHTTGYSVPEVGEIIEMGGRFGLEPVAQSLVRDFQ